MGRVKQNKYEQFLATKIKAAKPVGFEVKDLSPCLKDYQRRIVEWSLRRGRAALFTDTGTGKTAMQLEWAHRVSMETGMPVLILAPLAVAEQTKRECEKLFDFEARVVEKQEQVGWCVNITNYEKLHHFSPEDFGGIVLDESSILKSFDGKTRKALDDFAENIHYRLACTATPAPNDLIEIINHAEFLGIMGEKEIKALYFTQDGNTTHKWRLKGHARAGFWKWVASWAVAMRKPSNLGFSDDGFVLPELRIKQKTVTAPPPVDALFDIGAKTLQERRRARKDSTSDRVNECAAMVNLSTEHWLVWCDFNDESAALKKAIPDAVEVKGSDSSAHKTDAMLGFAEGRYRVLISKPSICGFGMNWQHCRNMAFVGMSDSYEQQYQAIRRCWRYGQAKPVNVWQIVSEADGDVVANIQRKEREHVTMMDSLIQEMNIDGGMMAAREEMEYSETEASGKGWRLLLGDSAQRIKEIESDSIGLSVFSPPFPGMYTYSNSPRDIGNCADLDELVAHFSFLIPDLYRITMPGRSCAIHLTQQVAFKGTDGFTGLRDFRGRVIDAMTKAGWIYYGEVTIDKNPQVKAIRTKDAGLQFKSLATDSARMHMALADYILQFKKPGDNPRPIRAGVSEKYQNPNGWITRREWIEWAAPVWYRNARGMDGLKPRQMPTADCNHAHGSCVCDREIEYDLVREQPSYPDRYLETAGISETDVLNVAQARDTNDERHLCPLQLGVIERCVKLWSAPGDIVLSPFAGIGSEGYEAVRLHRQFIGIELKPSYFQSAIRNLRQAEEMAQREQNSLLSFIEQAEAAQELGAELQPEPIEAEPETLTPEPVKPKKERKAKAAKAKPQTFVENPSLLSEMMDL